MIDASPKRLSSRGHDHAEPGGVSRLNPKGNRQVHRAVGPPTQMKGGILAAGSPQVTPGTGGERKLIQVFLPPRPARGRNHSRRSHRSEQNRVGVERMPAAECSKAGIRWATGPGWVSGSQRVWRRRGRQFRPGRSRPGGPGYKPVTTGGAAPLSGHNAGSQFRAYPMPSTITGALPPSRR